MRSCGWMLALVIGGCDLTRPNPAYCDETRPCATGVCDLPVHTCIDGVDSAAGWDGTPAAWGLPEYVLNINTSVADELTPSATADHLELYFVRNGDIYVTTRTSTDSLWGLPRKVDVLADAFTTELSPELSSNGLEMYLVIDNYINRSTRATLVDPWSTPLLNGNQPGQSPALTGDGLTMYYVFGFSVMKKTRASLADPWGPAVSAEIPGDPAYASVTVAADDRTLLLSAAVDFGLPQVIELSRASTTTPWGDLTEVPTLTALSPPPRDCDFFADPNAMYCALSDGADYDIFVVRRAPQ